MTPYGPAQAPGLPPGPGVQPPFAAPPIDGDRTRVWVGLGVGAAIAVLCCLGGVVGLGGLMVTGVRAINEQARVTVGDYLDALDDDDYVRAYALLCDSAQRHESVQDFADRLSGSPQVANYTLRDVRVADEVVLPVDVRYESGRRDTLEFRLEQDGRTGELEVCGVE